MPAPLEVSGAGKREEDRLQEQPGAAGQRAAVTSPAPAAALVLCFVGETSTAASSAGRCSPRAACGRSSENASRRRREQGRRQPEPATTRRGAGADDGGSERKRQVRRRRWLLWLLPSRPRSAAAPRPSSTSLCTQTLPRGRQHSSSLLPPLSPRSLTACRLSMCRCQRQSRKQTSASHCRQPELVSCCCSPLAAARTDRQSTLTCRHSAPFLCLHPVLVLFLLCRACGCLVSAVGRSSRPEGDSAAHGVGDAVAAGRAAADPEAEGETSGGKRRFGRQRCTCWQSRCRFRTGGRAGGAARAAAGRGETVRLSSSSCLRSCSRLCVPDLVGRD